MSYWDTPMSTLEAVNICLRAIGQTPVTTLDDPWPDVESAIAIIDDMSRSLQSRGWHWNREKMYLTPDEDNYVQLPANTASADTTDEHAYINAVQRGTRMYDRENNTYEFTQPRLRVQLTQLFPFDDLPLHARVFIALSAATEMQQDQLGSDSVDKKLKERAGRAWVQLVRDETRNGDHNMLRDSWSVQGALSRHWFSRGAY